MQLEELVFFRVIHFYLLQLLGMHLRIEMVVKHSMNLVG